MNPFKNFIKLPGLVKSIIFDDYSYILSKAGSFLPIGLYLVNDEGYFKYCNEPCRKILGIPPGADISERLIKNYYVHHEQREEFIKKLEQQQGLLIAQVIKFKRENDQRIIYVEDNCQRHDDRLISGKYYFVGSITDITENVHFREMFDDLNAGIFRINRNHFLEMANEAVAKIFGYNSVDKIKNVDMSKHWKDRKAFEKYISLLEKEGELQNFQAEMQNKDGKSIHISINSKLWKNDKGLTIGREGTFTDNTKEMKYVQTLERFSIGYYEVKYVKDKQLVFGCNDMFARMHGYEQKDEVIGLDISSFHYDEKERFEFFKNIEQAENNNQEVFNKKILRARKKNGTPFWVQVDIALERDNSGKVVGREGIVVDINERILLEIQLQEKQAQLNETLEDMDKFVHQYIAPIMNIDSTAQTLMEILEARLSKKMEEIKNIDISESYLNNLIENIDEFFAKIKQEEAEDKLILKLKRQKANLTKGEKQYSDPILLELWIREIIFEMLALVDQLIEKYKNHPEFPEYSILKKIRRNVLDVYDFYIIKLAHRILTNSHITYKVIETLRNYLFTGREQEFDFSRMNIIKILKENIDMYYNMAKQKGLNIIPPKQDYILMDISEANIDRMFSNLVLNAIKYSYKRPGGYVDIKVKDRRNDVEIKITNYGVPVEKDELEKVFEFSYRGKHSYDWNRTGSGIGLADAKKTVEKHNGQIDLVSIPARQFAHDSSRERLAPYITTVTVILPKRRKVR